MSIKLSFAVVLSVLTTTAVNTGHVALDDSTCSNIGGKPQDCMKLTDCDSAFQMLNNVTLPVSNTTRDYLRKIHCGFDGDTPMVCCLTEATPGVDKSILRANKSYSHRNLHLLAKYDCGQSEQSRIFGGIVSELYEFPWMALLAYISGEKRKFLCGGSLISDKYVLTAAHCITDQLLGVRIGEYDIKRKLDCISYLEKNYCAPPVQDFELEETIKHEHYLRLNVSNDIALIRLRGSVDLSKKNAKPVCLPIYKELQEIDLVGQSVYVTGWGITEKEIASNVLLKVILNVTSTTDCIDKYNMFNQLSDASLHINDNKLCAGHKHKDSCRGDSGGPMIYPYLYQGTPRYIQYGVVSYGSQFCGLGTPGVYTRVTKYLDWILDNMEP